MHTRGCLPHCLILGLLAGCASPRYVGSIGRDGTYSNRGYGIAVPLESSGLSDRWKAIDPSKLERAPRKYRPSLINAPLDVDGNGYLEVTEQQEFTRPTLRLISKTSTVSRMDVQVTILGGKNRVAPLDALLTYELRHLASETASAAVARMEKKNLRGNDAYVTTLTGDNGKFYRVALIDQPEMIAEEGIKRRQVVKITLATEKPSDDLTKDHDRLLEAVILSRRGSSEGVKEKW